MQKYSFTALAILLLLAACAPQAATSTMPPIVLSPDAQPVSESIANCMPIDAASLPPIEIRYPSTINVDDVAALIRLGEPDPDAGFAAQIAWEHIVLVVNPSNDVDISRDTAADLFSGRVENWSDIGGADSKVSLWVGPQSDEARVAFETSVLRGSPVSGSARLVTDPQAILDAVASDPAAMGILPAAWADESVRQIDLGLQVPVIAVASQEPSGAVRDLLACLQSPTGQAALFKHYSPLQ